MSLRPKAYKIDRSLFNIDLRDLYVETKPFSKGAYSKVYKAKYKDERVCVKVISKDLDPDDPNFFEYVEREIILLKMVDHPNVVKFYGAAEDDEDFYIVTEYIPGGNIRQYIQSKQELSWDIKIHIAIGVAQGLGALHAVKVLHRDIKSENFLVGDGWQIKVCDLGFARKVESLGRKRSMSICGTEEYMSPEMMVGLDYNEKVDVFSYGIFLTELITQCYLPNDFKRTAATQFGIDAMKFKELVPPDCPSLLSDLVVECCAFSPSNRPEFEKVVHRLVDIRDLLPHFDLGPTCSFEYFEEAVILQTEPRSRAFVEEITVKEYFIDEAAEGTEETDGQEFEEVQFEEINLDDVKLSVVDYDAHGAVADAYTTTGTNIVVAKDGNDDNDDAELVLHNTKAESERKRRERRDSIKSLDRDFAQSPVMRPIFQSFASRKSSNSSPGFGKDTSDDSYSQQEEDTTDESGVDYLEMEMEELNVVNVNIVEVPDKIPREFENLVKNAKVVEIPDKTIQEFDNSFVTRNEKYSYYYN